MKILSFQSSKIYKNNSSGINGLHFCPRDKIWYAQIQVDKKRKRKCFKEQSDAVKWLEEQKSIIH